MVDVARLAGVAPITVSRVANGHDSVVGTTRRRVLDAMAELGYQPNTAARALATGRFGTIGVVTFTMASYGNAQTIAATVAAAERHGYTVTLSTAPAISQGEVEGAFARLVRQAVDGVIVLMEARLLGGRRLTLPSGVPVVVADSGGSSDYCVVDSDQAGGARQATEHLLSLGHGTVWHMAGPEDSFSATARRNGWEATLMRALHEAGRAIPEEVSVVGFDDMEDAESFWPPLTTVRQRFDAVGELCVDSLLHEIRHETGDLRTHIVPTSLVVRRSTGGPPGGR